MALVVPRSLEPPSWGTQMEGENATARHVLLVSLGIRSPQHESDLSAFYQLAWPAFVQVVFVGIILVSFIERYSPVKLARAQALRQRDHTVIVGYDHLAKRMVDHLRENNRPFVVVAATENAVEELLEMKEAVVVVRSPRRGAGRRARRRRTARV